MEQNYKIKSIIRLYFPFKTHHTTQFRIKMVSDKTWETENSLDTGFYLGYIDRIFNRNGVYSDCVVAKTSVSDLKLQAAGVSFLIDKARIFSFDTSVAFLELSINYNCDRLDALENLTSALRLSNIENIILSNGERVTLNSIAEGIINKFGRCSMFEHLGKSAETRPELFVSVISDTPEENTDLHAYRIASGLDCRYNALPTDVEFYSNFPYLRWAVTKRGVCNMATITDNAENNKFITNCWFDYTDTRYIIWYILIMHQKYSMYQYMNDIANRSTLGNLKTFQRKIMEFNTKYRFSIISEETSYQALYEISSNIKGLQEEFNDIDEEIERISEYYESIADKNGNRAMTIISLLCAVSAIKDFYDVLSGETDMLSIASFTNLSSGAQIAFILFILLIAGALLIVIPKTTLKQKIKSIIHPIMKFLFKL